MVQKFGKKVFLNGLLINECESDAKAFSSMLRLVRKNTTVVLSSPCCSKGFDQDDEGRLICRGCKLECLETNAFEVDFKTQVN